MKPKLTTMLAARMAVISCAMLAAPCHADVHLRLLGGSHLPNADAGMSNAWANASANWMTNLKNQLAGNGNATVGTGNEAAEATTRLDYKKMITTPTFTSFHGVTPVAGEHGGRFAFGTYLYTTNGDTYKPSDVTERVESFIDQGSGYVKGGGIDLTTNFSTTNFYRIRFGPGTDGIMGTTDDAPTGTQSGSIDSTGYLYGGLTVGINAGGSGTDQQKIDNAKDYMSAYRLKLRYTVTVPYKEADGDTDTRVFVTEVFGIVDPEPEQPQLRIEMVAGVPTLKWTSNGQLTLLQKSPNLATWLGGGYYYLPEGQEFILPTTEIGLNAKYFYRLQFD